MIDSINLEKINKIEGWCSQDKIETLYNLILQEKPKLIVEIGVFAGKSLIVQALALKKNQKGIIIGIDSWDNNDCILGMKSETDINWWKKVDLQKHYLNCLNNIYSFELKNYIKICKKTSENALTLIPNEIDILHIDGNHESENACKDVINYIPKVKKNGYIYFDDAGWKRTAKAVTILENQFNLKLIKQIKSLEQDNYCNLYQKI